MKASEVTGAYDAMMNYIRAKKMSAAFAGNGKIPVSGTLWVEGQSIDLGDKDIAPAIVSAVRTAMDQRYLTLKAKLEALGVDLEESAA